MKRRQSVWIGRAAFVAAALFCAASLALPCAMCAWEDFRLYETPVARPVIAGTIGSRGRELPAAYELFRKRLLSGTEITAPEQDCDPAEAVEILCEKTQHLVEADVLPESLAKQILSRLPQTQAAFVRSQDGVAQASCLQWDDAQSASPSSWHCDAQWLISHGLVTAYSTSLPASELDTARVLDAYRTYLGLDALDDWQTVRVQTSSPDTAAMWSAEGQVYLYCCASETGFDLGAVSLTQDALPLP